MFSANKYETTNRSTFGVKSGLPKETTNTNYNHNLHGLNYRVGGGGRDTYIFNDNGGFTSLNRPRGQEKGGGFLPKVNRSPDASKKFSSTMQQAKSVRYKTDGTGRDSYVGVGDGGFSSTNRAVAIDPRVVFQKSLRGY